MISKAFLLFAIFLHVSCATPKSYEETKKLIECGVVLKTFCVGSGYGPICRVNVEIQVLGKVMELPKTSYTKNVSIRELVVIGDSICLFEYELPGRNVRWKKWHLLSE